MKTSKQAILDASHHPMPFGKYKYTTVLEVYKKDPEYLKFLLTGTLNRFYDKFTRRVILLTFAAHGESWKKKGMN